MEKPSLIESGVKYFHYNMLKKCNEKRTEIQNIILNVSLTLILVGFIYGVYVYKKNTRPTELEKRIREYEDAEYILSKVKEIQMSNRHDMGHMITNLPPLHNDFLEVQSRLMWS